MAHERGLKVVPGTLNPETLEFDAVTGEVKRLLPNMFGNSMLSEALWFLYDEDVEGLYTECPETGLAAKAMLHAVRNNWITPPKLASENGLHTVGLS